MVCRIGKWFRFVSCLACLYWLAGISAHAQTVSEEQELKAAFVYNFTLFTSWPKPGRELRLCIRGDVPYATQLQEYEGRSSNGAVLRVVRMQEADDEKQCQVLVCGSGDQERFGESVKQLRNMPVLLVMDAVNPMSDYVHIALTKVGDRLTFDVNQTAGVASGLSFRFKLLKLARRVN